MRLGTVPFRDRTDAGRKLAEKLEEFKADSPIVLGLARGGVVVAAEIAEALGAPLEVLVARKIGAPMQPELGIGAVANGEKVLDHKLIHRLAITGDEVNRAAEREEVELERRRDLYLEGRPPATLTGKTVILVDDGLATGITALAAVRSVRAQHPKKIIVAFPVCSPQGAELLKGEVDEVICCSAPEDLYAVGMWYRDFSQTQDEEVIALLREARDRRPKGLRGLTGGEVWLREILIHADEVILRGDLAVPSGAFGVVLFAHGSGSGRLSPRNRFVASRLNAAGLGTLLVDLLTEKEEQEDRFSGHLRFDIGMLADRLHAATRWLGFDLDTQGLPIGYFGASTGAAAALVASVRNLASVKAIVSRGGRPDLAGTALKDVTAPTLLLVGTLDEPIIPLNQQAFKEMPVEQKELTLIEGATHLFEEVGRLEMVADYASDWFARHLQRH